MSEVGIAVPPAERRVDPRLQGTSLGWLLNNVQIETEDAALTAHEVLSDELKKVNQAVVTAMNIAGKAKGKLEITINLNGDKGMIEPVITHKVTVPKKARTIPQLMFPTKEGGFSLENPRQLNLFQGPTQVS